jgi:hypothetical protein
VPNELHLGAGSGDAKQGMRNSPDPTVTTLSLWQTDTGDIGQMKNPAKIADWLRSPLTDRNDAAASTWS